MAFDLVSFYKKNDYYYYNYFSSRVDGRLRRPPPVFRVLRRPGRARTLVAPTSLAFARESRLLRKR